MANDLPMTERSIEPDDRGLVLTCPKCCQRNRLVYARLGQKFRCAQCHTELSSPTEPIEVKKESVFEAVTSQSSLPVLVDFWAPWCGPCKMVAPEVAKVARRGSGRWIVVKVNTEELPGLAQRLRITEIPLIAVFKGGRELGRQADAIPASAIRQFVEQAGQAVS
jgi:thioredoxin 2